MSHTNRSAVGSSCSVAVAAAAALVAGSGHLEPAEHGVSTEVVALVAVAVALAAAVRWCLVAVAVAGAVAVALGSVVVVVAGARAHGVLVRHAGAVRVGGSLVS